jgi:hypothetical protein
VEANPDISGGRFGYNPRKLAVLTLFLTPVLAPGVSKLPQMFGGALKIGEVAENIKRKRKPRAVQQTAYAVSLQSQHWNSVWTVV